MTSSRATRRLVPGALVLGLVLALTAGCGADEELTVGTVVGDVAGLFPTPAAPLRSVLELDGTPARSVGVLAPGLPTGGASTVSADGTVVVATDRGLVAYDPAASEQAWSTPVAGGACAVSEVVDDRVAVLLDDRNDYARCQEVGVVDLSDGSLLWRRGLRGSPGLFHTTVALGARHVYAGGECGSVLRFSPADGSRQDPLLPADRVCGHANAASDGLLALWEDAETTATPDDRGTGWIPPYDGAGRLRVIDTGDGERLWARTLDRRGGDLSGIVTTDPLVLDVTEKGHRTMQRYDEGGELVGHLGAQLPTSSGFTVAARSGDVLVGSYDRVPGYRAYDLVTGEELWRTSADRWLAGADGRGLVWTQTARVAEDPGVGTQVQALRSAPDDPERTELLGALPDAEGVVASVVGDDLLVPRGRTTSVVPLGDGTGTAPPPDVYAPAGLAWSADDVRPEQVEDVCDVVGADDLDAIGLRTDLPAPVDCRWFDISDPSYLEKELEVTVQAVPPQAGLEPRPAADVAASLYDDRRRRWPVLPGLGDEARAVTQQSADASRASAAVDVRTGNVLVSVASSVEAQISSTTRGAVTAAELQRVVVDVAADVLDHLDRPVDPDALPVPGGAGTVAVAPDACRAVGDDLPAGVAADRRADVSPDDEAVSSCSWVVPVGQPGTDLQVTAFAVPAGRFPDADGETPSADEVADSLRVPGRAYPAAGPPARLRDVSEPGEYVSQLLTVRRDNLVVTVDASAFEEPLPVDLEADLLRVARRVLDASSR